MHSFCCVFKTSTERTTGHMRECIAQRNIKKKTNLCSKVMQHLCTLIVPFGCLPRQACHVQEDMKVLFPESLLVCHTVGCCGISDI